MAWVRIDDTFADHPKMLRAGSLGVALWLEGLAYANRHLTDGRLARHVVASFRLVRQPLKVAELLVDVGLWERADDEYQIHDYAEHYPSAADVRARRAADAERKRRGTPSGLRSDSGRSPDVRARAGAGTGTGVDRIGETPSEEPSTSTAPVDPPSRAAPSAERRVWDAWRAAAEQAGTRLPLEPSPRDFEHLRVLAQSYEPDGLTDALAAWWSSAHVTRRYLGQFRADLGDVLGYLADPAGRPAFGAPSAARSARAAPAGAWRAACQHHPTCSTPTRCALLEARTERGAA